MSTLEQAIIIAELITQGKKIKEAHHTSCIL